MSRKVPPSLPKKKPDNKSVDIPDNLSEEERIQFLRATGIKTGPSAEPETISRKAHEDEVAELKSRISKLDEDLDKIKKERGKLREERDDYKSRFETKLDELNTKNEEMDKLREKNRQHRDRIKELENSLNTKASETTVIRDDTEIRRLGEELENLKKKLKTTEERNEVLESENTALQSAVDDLEAEISDLKDQAVMRNDQPTQDTASSGLEITALGTVRRTSPAVFESELFTSPRYLVKLARSGRTISFTPDVEGAAVCSNGSMTLPRLAELLPFDGTTEYEAYSRGGTEVVVPLV